MLDSIAICHSIRYFSLELAVAHLFTPDIEHLKAHFLHGWPLISTSLDIFSDTLTSMQSLRRVHIRMRPMPTYYGPQPTDTEDETFLHFAFSGIRESMIWAAFDERMQGNDIFNTSNSEERKLSGISVWTNFYPARDLREGGHENLKYAAWLEWCKENRKENRVEEHAQED